MPTLDTAVIAGFVRADDLDVIRTINNVPAGQGVTDAWLTVDNPLGTHLFQKHITTTLTGNGQITDDGSTTTIAIVRFALKGGPTGDTTLMSAGVSYPYDIQVKTTGGKIYTPESGFPTSGGGIKAEEQVTTEIS